MSDDHTKVPAKVLTQISQQLLNQAGVPQDQSALIAEVIVEADLRGIGSHGVLRLPAYIHRVLKGTMTARTELRVIRERGATLLLDGGHGFGQVAGAHAMEEAIKRAAEFGSGLVGVRDVGHFGIAAFYTMMALPKKMIGMISANAAPSMAAWGGTTPLLGTNPISVAIPTGLDVDIVLDMASSVAARGKIRYAVSQDHQIPTGWALDRNGQPTQDPHEAIKGTLLPIGGPKGYGLALIVDTLAGVLTGSAFGPNLPSLHETSRDVAGGLVVQAIDISTFADLEAFEERLQSLIQAIRDSTLARNVERIYLPGEIEFLTKQERQEHGIPVPENLIGELDGLAGELGIELEWTSTQ